MIIRYLQDLEDTEAVEGALVVSVVGCEREVLMYGLGTRGADPELSNRGLSVHQSDHREGIGTCEV